MAKLMTRLFDKWISKYKIPDDSLSIALNEVANGNADANLGGNLYKKRIRFEGKGKSGSGRSIICFKKDKIAIYIHGFAKGDQENISKRELKALKEFSKVLTNLSIEQIQSAIESGDFVEVKNGK